MCVFSPLQAAHFPARRRRRHPAPSHKSPCQDGLGASHFAGLSGAVLSAGFLG